MRARLPDADEDEGWRERALRRGEETRIGVPPPAPDDVKASAAQHAEDDASMSDWQPVLEDEDHQVATEGTWGQPENELPPVMRRILRGGQRSSSPTEEQTVPRARHTSGPAETAVRVSSHAVTERVETTVVTEEEVVVPSAGVAPVATPVHMPASHAHKAAEERKRAKALHGVDDDVD